MLKRVKLRWKSPDYYPLEQAILKSGFFFDGSPEGNQITAVAGFQYTLGALSSPFCGVLFTNNSDTGEMVTAAGSICDPNLIANLDLNVNYCSICL